MKRRIPALLLTLALALTLAGCTKPAEPTPSPEPPPVTDPPPAEPETLILDVLNVEFAVDGRDADALLVLQGAFGTALEEALSKQNVLAGVVNVTFGTSSEATMTTLRLGTVQLAFLSAEEGFAYRNGEVIALEQGEEGDLSRSMLVLAFAEPHFAEALRAALPELAPVLADYAGAYEVDDAAVEALRNLIENENNDNP